MMRPKLFQVVPTDEYQVYLYAFSVIAAHDTRPA